MIALASKRRPRNSQTLHTLEIVTESIANLEPSQHGPLGRRVSVRSHPLSY
jgi:hypothetical protein